MISILLRVTLYVTLYEIRPDDPFVGTEENEGDRNSFDFIDFIDNICIQDVSRLFWSYYPLALKISPVYYEKDQNKHI